MAELGLDWSSLVAFDHVAAGHEGVMSDASGSLVIKPCVQAEVEFYEISNAEHPDFAQLMPTFMGSLQRGKSEQLERHLAAAASRPTNHAAAEAIVLPPALDEGAANRPESVEPTIPQNPLRGKKLDTELAIVLENVLAGFKKPNFVDVKLGKRLWADDALPAKRAKLDEVASQTTSGSLGFRVAGMKIWQVNSGEYKEFNKFYGRNLTSDTVKDAFSALLCLDQKTEAHDLTDDIISNIEEAVGEVESVIANQESRMYSASLLLVYEGEPQARKEAIEAAMAETVRQRKNEGTSVREGHMPDEDGDGDEDEDDDDDGEDEVEQKLFDIKVIDFAHAAWTPGQGPDENMLCGIRNVRRVLKGLTKVGSK